MKEPSRKTLICEHCGALRSGAYCAQCGAPEVASRRLQGIVRWLGVVLLGVALLVVVAVMVIPNHEATLGSDRGSTPEGVLAATPRGRFQQLVDLVSAAAASGQTESVRELSQRAVAAFATIPPAERDVDSRYHLAMLKAVGGDGAGALAEADEILSASPGNLFGYYVQGAVARLQGNSTGVQESAAAFKAHFQQEVAKARPEYIEHRDLLDAYLRQP